MKAAQRFAAVLVATFSNLQLVLTIFCHFCLLCGYDALLMWLCASGPQHLSEKEHVRKTFLTFIAIRFFMQWRCRYVLLKIVCCSKSTPAINVRPCVRAG